MKNKVKNRMGLILKLFIFSFLIFFLTLINIVPFLITGNYFGSDILDDWLIYVNESYNE